MPDLSQTWSSNKLTHKSNMIRYNHYLSMLLDYNYKQKQWAYLRGDPKLLLDPQGSLRQVSDLKKDEK